MDNKYKILSIIAVALSIISLVVSMQERFRTATTSNQVCLETKIVHDEHFIALLNPYTFPVYDIYLAYKLETHNYYSMIHCDMLDKNTTERYGPWPDKVGNFVRVVDAYAYGVKP